MDKLLQSLGGIVEGSLQDSTLPNLSMQVNTSTVSAKDQDDIVDTVDSRDQQQVHMKGVVTQESNQSQSGAESEDKVNTKHQFLYQSKKWNIHKCIKEIS